MEDENNKSGDGMSGRDCMMTVWQQLGEKGVEFFVDGESVPMQEAFSRAVNEDSVYMADYVWGTEGQIQQIRLDRIDLE